MLAKVTLKAVHDTDLIKVLKKLHIYELIIQSRCRCSICGRAINLENLGGLYKDDDGDVQVVCNDIRCLYNAAEKISRRTD